MKAREEMPLLRCALGPTGRPFGDGLHSVTASGTDGRKAVITRNWDMAGSTLKKPIRGRKMGVGAFSDVPGDLQLRWIEDDNRVTVFRKPSGNSNGNTFDYQGRQISCQHGPRRVVRYEHDGSETVLASRFNGKKLNSPNDVVVRRNDDSIWFTDPSYGITRNYTGTKARSELKEAVYRIDAKTGGITKVTDDIVKPNGLCFSPDLKKLYVADTGEGSNDIKVWDIDGASLKNGKQFASMKLDGLLCMVRLFLVARKSPNC